MKLYDFPRSSASYRVRIACNLKGLEPERIFINFRENAQRSGAYLAVNPAGLLPALVTETGESLGQSLAILRYLDHLAPEPALFPSDPMAEARVLESCLTIACDIHPLNNLRVLQHLKGEYGLDQAAVDDWYRHWVRTGFITLEALAGRYAEGYCAGDELSAADICLVPQMFNARRFDVPLDDFPTLVAIDARMQEIEAVRAAAPEA
ncbi:MAG: maleylacetoacetate isomerase [Erythrobacter sp.]|uniref:maleylacetoacetate isomerase n=1 Tax=Erythrobacter sp. TaxID=1042 RepID=UPI0026140D89|nr:maleylacetoacetate isomerase [Erythrobacter sp.]MDJ0978141.1 maleylacetoacetate isomerase [Erythrobacter sp.]